MLVDAEIEQVRKAGTAQDLDDDGVLGWSELRRAVLKLSTKLVRARRRPTPHAFVTPATRILHSSRLYRRRPSPTLRVRDL